MQDQAITGLNKNEIEAKKNLGLINTQIDTFSPTYTHIVLKNIFTAINISLFPLIVTLLLIGVFREVFSLLFFMIAMSITNTIDEIRVKRRLDELKKKFQSKVTVIRFGGEQIEIPTNEVVQGDFILAKEGESIIADGKIVKAFFTQLDESALTGESDYVPKEKGDGVLSGSFVVTGNCIYVAEKVGKDNYLNILGAESTHLKEKTSRLEKFAEQLMSFFILIGIVFGVIHFLAIKDLFPLKDALLAVTTVVSLAIPQSMLVIITLTYVVSVAKLAKDGVLVQKRGAIDDLSDINMICMDKTGTITSNEMHIAEIEYRNLDEKKTQELFSKVYEYLYGSNRTIKTILDKYNNEKILAKDKSTFDQIPFTSKAKMSAFQIDGESMILGAPEKVIENIKSDQSKDFIRKWVKKQQTKERRVIVGIYFKDNIKSAFLKSKMINSDSFVLFSFEEELNPGIEGIIQELKNQKIEVKVISGDSAEYVAKIAKHVGIDTEFVLDLSVDSLEEKEISKYTVFARAKPEDKSQIIKALQLEGKKVAMIGDGVNDTLGLKQSHVGIAMEKGANVAKDVADIVLLNNDYTKLPKIFFEGNNLIFNLKFATKIYLMRTIMLAFITIFFSYQRELFPVLPTAALIPSFLGTSAAGYFITFTRKRVENENSSLKNLVIAILPVGLLQGIFTIALYINLKDSLSFIQLSTAMAIAWLGMSLAYTLYLLIKARKFPPNRLIIIGTFIYTMFFGIIQTIVPIYQVTELWEKIVFLFVVIIGAAIMYKVIVLISKDIKEFAIFKYIAPIGCILLAIFFPSRAYYSVEPVPVSYYLQIMFVVLLFITGLKLYDRAMAWLKSRESSVS